MQSLVLAAVSIVLIAALAIASIFYGGSIYLTSAGKMDAAGLVNSASQISSAQSFYVTDHANTPATSIADLVAGGYLSNDLTGVGGVSSQSKWSIIPSHPGAPNGIAYLPFGPGTNAVKLCNGLISWAGVSNAVYFCADSLGNNATPDSALGFGVKL